MHKLLSVDCKVLLFLGNPQYLWTGKDISFLYIYSEYFWKSIKIVFFLLVDLFTLVEIIF